LLSILSMPSIIAKPSFIKKVVYFPMVVGMDLVTLSLLVESIQLADCVVSHI
jgi:hypothetical protein